MTSSNLRNLTVPALLTATAIFLSALLLSSSKGHQLSAVDLRLEVGRLRPIEAQLSVNRSYARCESVKVPAESVPWSQCQVHPEDTSVDSRALGKAVATIDESDPWSSGLTYLLRIREPANLDRAIERLERAHKEAPKDPARANDLAAVLVERAGRQNQPVDLVAALELIEEALGTGTPEPWLLFNRALVLEKLRLLNLARQAWQRYSDESPVSSWEAEARSHFVELNIYVMVQAEPTNDYLLRAAKTSNVTELNDLADRYPREAREFALEVALRGWSGEILADHRGEAGRWYDAVRILGNELAHLGGDQTVLEAAEEIEALRQNRSNRERRLAQGYQLYGKGHEFFQKRDYSQAAPLLAAAESQLTTIDSPAAGWATLDLGAIQLYKNQNREAVAIFYSLLAGCDISKHPSLCGRAAWGQGLGLFRLGRLSEALIAYRTSAAAFLPTRERDNRAGAFGLIAETLRELGDTSSAWQYRYQGLRVLGGQTRHRSNHNLLWEGGEAALEEGYTRAAELFGDEDVALFGNGTDRLLALEAYLRRAEFRRGRVPSSVVLADLNNAVAISRELPNSPLLPRIEADVQLALAQVASERNPRQAEAALDRTLEFFRDHELVLREAATLLLEARLAKGQGEVLQARGYLEDAVSLFEARRAQLASEDQRLYSETWQGIYDELIELAAAQLDGAHDALRLLKQSRGEESHRAKSPNTIDPSIVTVAFALHSEALYRFELQGGKLNLQRFAISRSALASKISNFVESVRFGLHDEVPASDLSNLLIPANLAPGALVCFVPDRELSRLPFAALPLPDNPAAPIVTRHAIVLANSVDACEAANRRIVFDSNKDKMLLVSSPRLDRKEYPLLLDLPAAANEATLLLGLYPNSTLLAGNSATAPALLKALPDTTILHFAGHAVSHPTRPVRSFLPLAPDPAWRQASLLSAAELAKLRLPKLQLAILSACSTFAPQSRRSEGISGLVSALLDAGAHAVVGTLWDVHDEPSRELLVEFHRQLNATGNAAYALHVAQLRCFLNSASKFGGKNTWAAFELVVR